MCTLGVSEGPLQRAVGTPDNLLRDTRADPEERMADLGGHVSALFSQRCQPTVPTHTVLGVPAAPRCAHLPRAHDALAGPGRTLGVKTSHHPLAILQVHDLAVSFH